MWTNLSLKSSIFRHALRVSIACVIGFIVVKFISTGHHSYWVLLTIAFILKPAFGLTRQRNIHRILGTVAGGLVGVLLFLFVQNESVLFVFMVIFMIATYTFLRTNYLLMVFSTTPYVLLLLKFLGVGFINLAGERILDTGIGCAIALTASYYLFPAWEVDQFSAYCRSLVESNRNYLKMIINALKGNEIEVVDYKVARKDVYLSYANLSAAFQRVTSEPASKQLDRKRMHQFVVLSHILVSNIASLAKTVFATPTKHYAPEIIQPLRSALKKMNNALGSEEIQVVIPPAENIPITPSPLLSKEKALVDQAGFIRKICEEQEKNMLYFLGEET